MTRIYETQLMAAVTEAQYQSIRGWLLTKYVGNFAMLEPYSDHYYSISYFMAGNIDLNLSVSQIRTRLHQLADKGLIERQKRSYGPVAFRLSRAECDRLAERAIQYWLSKGFLLGQKTPYTGDYRDPAPIPEEASA